MSIRRRWKQRIRQAVTILLALPLLGQAFAPSSSKDAPACSSSRRSATETEKDASPPPPLALVTGVSRSIGIGKAIAQRLQDDGYRVVAAGWSDYDARMPWGSDEDTSIMPFDGYYQVDLEDPVATQDFVPRVCKDMEQPVAALVLCHCESVDSDILTTTLESFDKHMAVNARATWQLVRGFAEQYTDSTDPPGLLRIVSITSDHTAGNLPYGASKGAMDRIVLAAAHELKHLRLTANVVNPGAVDTGWMSGEIKDWVLARNLQPRIGQPSDTANLVSFLCSEQGQWINGQILYSDGGLK